MKKYKYSGEGTTIKTGEEEIILENGQSYELDENHAAVKALVASNELSAVKRPVSKKVTEPASTEGKLKKYIYEDHTPGFVKVGDKEIHLDTGKSYDLPEDHAIIRFLVKQNKLVEAPAEEKKPAKK